MEIILPYYNIGLYTVLMIACLIGAGYLYNYRKMRKLTDLPPNYYLRFGHKDNKGRYTGPREYSYRQFYENMTEHSYYRHPLFGRFRRWRLIRTLLIAKEL